MDRHSQIIDDIGPLVSCMCDDVERKLFGCKKYWHESILPFIAIIHNMLDLECNFTKLSQYKGLFEMIVQSWFWESQRRDIVNEFNTFVSTADFKVAIMTEGVENDDPSATMKALGGNTTFKLLEWARKTDDAKKMLGDIGSVPIVSRAYDPNCKVSLVGGIIRHMKKPGDRRNYFQALTLLIHHAECVDKDVIAEMIDCGTNFTSEYEDAGVITQLIWSMITQKMDSDDAEQPIDSRTAFAIRAGLLDLCVEMIARFGGVKDGIVCWITSILRNIYLLSFHRKTSKAIGDKRGHLIEEFERLKENKQVTNSDCTECNRALSIIQSILDITSTNCVVCNKETERKDMKKCAACKSACYCSEECQRKDWHSGGHDCDCNNIIDGYHQVLLPELRGNNERETAKLKDLDRNIMMAQNSLFLEHADAIREQLAAKEAPSSEYIVHFNVSQCPLAVMVISYTEFFVSCNLKKWFEEKIQSDDENILCIFQSAFFNGNSNWLGQSFVVYNFFPREWLSTQASSIYS